MSNYFKSISVFGEASMPSAGSDIFRDPYMGHRDQDGKKVDEMSLFKQKVLS